eukprot:540754_1
MSGHGETAELNNIPNDCSIFLPTKIQKFFESDDCSKLFEEISLQMEQDPEMQYDKYLERCLSHKRIYWEWECQCVQFIFMLMAAQNDHTHLYTKTLSIERLKEAMKYLQRKFSACRDLEFHAELLDSKDAINERLIWHQFGDRDTFFPDLHQCDDDDLNIMVSYVEYECPKQISKDLPMLELKYLYSDIKMQAFAKWIWNCMMDNTCGLRAFDIFTTCYLKTFILPRACVYYIFSKSEGLKLLFANLIGKPIEKRNIYSVLITVKFLQFVIKNFPKICNLIFHGKHKLYKQLFLFWKNYMKFYWKQKQNMQSSDKMFALKLMLDKMNIVPLVVHTMTGWPDHDNGSLNGTINFCMINNKCLIYEWILDLIAGILTNTIEESKWYWIGGENEMNIMRYLLSNSNCQFLFNWLIEQYRANQKHYRESQVRQYIEYYDQYFWTMKSNHAWENLDDDIEEEEKCEFQSSMLDYGKIEFSLSSICTIRDTIGRYYEKNKDKLLAGYSGNLCKTPRELFTQWRLYKTLLLLKRKDKNIGNSAMIYYHIINKVVKNNYYFQETYPLKESYKGVLSTRINCGLDCCGNTKADVKMYTCKGCYFVRYCSRNCQKKDWNKYHRTICKTLVVFA